MKKINFGLCGASGRMGEEVQKILSAHKNTSVYAPSSRGKWDERKVDQVDVWIDFSTPEALQELIKKTKKTPIVSGTTGISSSVHKLLRVESKKRPILWATNMSLGVAVLNESLKAMKAIAHFDFQIEEFHHNKKKDNPSGTAITLQENLKKAVGKSLPEPLGIRGGGIFGVHKVHAMSDEEVLTFEHTALNRAVFAKGAVMAATWLVNKKPGFYEIRDVLFGN